MLCDTLVCVLAHINYCHGQGYGFGAPSKVINTSAFVVILQYGECPIFVGCVYK